MRVPRSSRPLLAGLTALVIGVLTLILHPAPASAAPADCERGANGFIDIPNTLVGTQVGQPAPNQWAGRKITQEYTRRGGGRYGFARISGGSPHPTDSVWMDVSHDGGATVWIQCGPFAASQLSSVTSAAYPTSSSSQRKFRACGKVYVLRVECTPWW
jgi:hypothetical protein